MSGNYDEIDLERLCRRKDFPKSGSPPNERSLDEFGSDAVFVPNLIQTIFGCLAGLAVIQAERIEGEVRRGHGFNDMQQNDPAAKFLREPLRVFEGFERFIRKI